MNGGVFHALKIPEQKKREQQQQDRGSSRMNGRMTADQLLGVLRSQGETESLAGT
jgi:hypothetical protein